MKKPRPDFKHESAHYNEGRISVGVDEVGRGCLAGPVVTAAVVLPVHLLKEPFKRPKNAPVNKVEAIDEDGPWWLWLNDSKLVSPPVRERLSEIICKQAQVHIAWCDAEEIDRWNILRAAMIAMQRATHPFADRAQAVLVDGNMNPFHPRYLQDKPVAKFSHVELLIKGDQRSMSIAAASIVAKVYRDRWMAELDATYPGYSFGVHKGYSTPAHYAALSKLGPCAIHRMSFAPLKNSRSEGCNRLHDATKHLPVDL